MAEQMQPHFAPIVVYRTRRPPLIRPQTVSEVYDLLADPDTLALFEERARHPRPGDDRAAGRQLAERLRLIHWGLAGGVGDPPPLAEPAGANGTAESRILPFRRPVSAAMR